MAGRFATNMIYAWNSEDGPSAFSFVQRRPLPHGATDVRHGIRAELCL